LPSFALASSSLKALRVIRFFRALRVLRVLKASRYSRSVQIILGVLRKSKSAIGAVCSLAAVYILVSALVMFNVEPDSFDTLYDAIYWATVSLTTVGYGDIYPVTTVGRAVAMLSSIFGIAVVALPAGIITAGYMDELQALRMQKEKKDELPE
ncbi:MAG: ion transporter, partial [Oscillospiraceae bacterium]|nr:ion transporter [Oscillospiraceae bacterium]